MKFLSGMARILGVSFWSDSQGNKCKNNFWRRFLSTSSQANINFMIIQKQREKKLGKYEKREKRES